MLTRETIKRVVGVEPIEQEAMSQAIDLWGQIYANQAPWLGSDVKSMSLASAIANEVARTVTIESSVEIEGAEVAGSRAEFLQTVMRRVMMDIREQLEYGVALGGMIFKPYIDGDGQIAVNYVKADSFYPMQYNSAGQIISAVFVDKREINKKWYTRLEYHEPTDLGIQVTNVAFKSTSESTLGTRCPLEEVPDWADILPIATILGISEPLFAYFRYPSANTVDRDSGMGVSCFARAVDMIEQADRLWSNFLWEFESGQRALYVDVLAFGKDDTGKPVLPNKKLYRTLDAGGQEDALFKDWSPTFRQQDLLAGLDAVLKRIEFNCGLAYGTLSDPQLVEKTATEIASSKQRTYATIVDTQQALEEALDELLWAIDQWVTIGNLAPMGPYLATYHFDDSIVVDKDIQFQSDLRLVNSGIMSKIEFRMRNLGEDEDTARKKIAEVQAEAPEPMFPPSLR